VSRRIWHHHAVLLCTPMYSGGICTTLVLYGHPTLLRPSMCRQTRSCATRKCKPTQGANACCAPSFVWPSDMICRCAEAGNGAGALRSGQGRLHQAEALVPEQGGAGRHVVTSSDHIVCLLLSPNPLRRPPNWSMH
jgi:hypothetical protein